MGYQISPENKRNNKKFKTKRPPYSIVATRKSAENDAPNNKVAKATNIATNSIRIRCTENAVITEKLIKT